MDDSGGARQAEQEGGVAESTRMEPSAPQVSMRSSHSTSCTGSERELIPGGGGPSPHLEQPVANHLPEKAAQVFSPAGNHFPPPHKENEVLWEMQSERSPFLGPRGLQVYGQPGFQDEWPEDRPPRRCKFSRLCSPLGSGLSSAVSLCRWAGLLQQEHPEGGRVLDDVGPPLPVPGVGRLCVPAVRRPPDGRRPPQADLHAALLHFRHCPSRPG